MSAAKNLVGSADKSREFEFSKLNRPLPSNMVAAYAVGDAAGRRFCGIHLQGPPRDVGPLYAMDFVVLGQDSSSASPPQNDCVRRRFVQILAEERLGAPAVS